MNKIQIFAILIIGAFYIASNAAYAEDSGSDAPDNEPPCTGNCGGGGGGGNANYVCENDTYNINRIVDNQQRLKELHTDDVRTMKPFDQWWWPHIYREPDWQNY